MSVQEASPTQPLALRAEATQEEHKAASKIQAAWRGLSVRLSKEPLSKDWKCVICMDGFEDSGAEGIFKGENAIKRTLCKHTFHKHCLERAIQEGPAGDSCPICRGATGVTVALADEGMVGGTWTAEHVENFGFTSLLDDAIRQGNVGRVTGLLANGVDVNLANQFGDTALSSAARNHADIEIINVLIAGGANVNMGGQFGSTPLSLALINETVETVNALIVGGANVNMDDQFGQTLFHWVVEKGDIEAVNALIVGGANVNMRGQFGSTPLHAAARRGDIEIVNALIVVGADKTIRDEDGRTPFDLALQRKNYNCAWALSTGSLLLKTFTRFVEAAIGESPGVSLAVFGVSLLYMSYLQSQSTSNEEGG